MTDASLHRIMADLRGRPAPLPDLAPEVMARDVRFSHYHDEIMVTLTALGSFVHPSALFTQHCPLERGPHYGQRKKAQFQALMDLEAWGYVQSYACGHNGVAITGLIEVPEVLE